MFPSLCYVFERNISSYCFRLFPNTCIVYLDVTLLYELLMGAVFYPTKLFISALLLKIMRKNIQTKPSERRKPNFWVWWTLHACSSQCLLQELQVLSTAEEKIPSICWEVGFLLAYTSLLPVPCRHVRYFLDKCRTHVFFICWQFVFWGWCLLFFFPLPVILGRKDRQNMDSLCKRWS